MVEEQGNFNSWTAVTEAMNLEPGDILVRPGGSVGHVMIVMGTPELREGTQGSYR